MTPMRSPVAMVVFAREDTTRRVFERVRQAQPPKLFVIADGPRPERPGEAERCAATRAVFDEVDWDCEVHRRLAEVNLGCGRSVSEGVSWVFEHVEEAVVLEDDCLPEPSFFPYCDELLERYRDDERVMVVSGNNFDPAAPATPPHSYGFQRNYGTWGWATWKRAWRHMDMAVPHWPALRDTSWLLDVQGTERAVAFWRAIFDRAHSAGAAADHWTFDYQWYCSCWAQHGLGIVPSSNLVTNIGFGNHATNTSWQESPLAGYPTRPIRLPLVHPPTMVRDLDADVRTFDFAFAPPVPPVAGPLVRARRRAVQALPAALQTRARGVRARLREVTG